MLAGIVSEEEAGLVPLATLPTAAGQERNFDLTNNLGISLVKKGFQECEMMMASGGIGIGMPKDIGAWQDHQRLRRKGGNGW